MILNQNEYLEKNKEQLNFVETIRTIDINSIEDLNYRYKIRTLDDSVNRSIKRILNLDERAPVKSKTHSDRIFYLLKSVVEIRDEAYDKYLNGAADYFDWFDSIERKLYDAMRK